MNKMQKKRDQQRPKCRISSRERISACMSINSDEAVAYGAAVQAALLSKGNKYVPNL